MEAEDTHWQKKSLKIFGISKVEIKAIDIYLGFFEKIMSHFSEHLSFVFLICQRLSS